VTNDGGQFRKPSPYQMQTESAPKHIIEICAEAFSIAYEKAYRAAIVQTKGNVYDAEGIAFEKAHKAWDRAKRQTVAQSAR
jgi:hypothetical protein